MLHTGLPSFKPVVPGYSQLVVLQMKTMLVDSAHLIGCQMLSRSPD